MANGSLRHWLLGFLLSSPILAHSQNSRNNTESSLCELDIFQQLKPAPLPVCSLTQSSFDHDYTAEILSFEEWKKKSLQQQQQQHPPVPSKGSSVDTNSDRNDTSANAERAGTQIPEVGTEKGGNESSSSTEYSGDQNPQEVAVAVDPTRNTMSVSRVPLTDRFNYASQDCTARIALSHKSSQSPSAVLSHKKDRYMLSPCNEAKKFVIVELCDDVRIDTVQLANFEFFSGVFKDIRISLAETFSAAYGWNGVDAGTYRAKNVRGVQVSGVHL